MGLVIALNEFEPFYIYFFNVKLDTTGTSKALVNIQLTDS